jgi:hypothetical protein
MGLTVHQNILKQDSLVNFIEMCTLEVKQSTKNVNFTDYDILQFLHPIKENRFCKKKKNKRQGQRKTDLILETM